MTENWKPVVGYEKHYEVSDFGRVRRITKSTRNPAGAVLKGSPDQHGYPCVTISDNGSNRKNVKVHKLVSGAFMGPPPPGMEVNHIDGDQSNARLENLEYVTHAENMRHAARTGLLKIGSARKCAKLSETDVSRIKALHAARGFGPTIIGRVWGVGHHAISDIINGVTWKHIAPAVITTTVNEASPSVTYKKKRVSYQISAV